MDNIHIAIVGCVSVGKSTLLNALLLKNYSEMKKTRTTMQPIIFEECENTLVDTDEYIYKNIQEANVLDINNYKLKEISFKIPKISNFIEDKKLKLTLYDIPGINDQQYKKHYEKYLVNNFKNFNIIYFVLNVEAGMNTKEIIDLLELLCKNIKKSQKKIYCLVIANKCEDLDSEIGNLFKEIKNMTNQKFDYYDIKDRLIDILPFNAIDAYLYRMIKLNNIVLDKKKIGVTKNGKLFNNNSEEEQNKIINEIVKDTEYIEKIITMSGFNTLNDTMKKFLTDDIYNEFRINNIITHNFHINLEKIFINLDNEKLLLSELKEFEKINNKIKEIDENIHKTFVQIFIINALDKIFNDIIIADNICELEKIRNTINDNIINKSFLKDIYEIKYQGYILDKMLIILKKRLNTKRNKELIKIKPVEIVNYLLLFFTTDKEYISKLFTIFSEISNISTKITEVFTNSQKNDIIKILDSVKDIVPNYQLLFFARFIIVNEIILDINLERQMFYDTNNCTILSKLCNLCSNGHSEKDIKNQCISILLKNSNNNDNLLLDFYCLKYICNTNIKEYNELDERIKEILSEDINYLLNFNMNFFKNYCEETESDKKSKESELESESEKESEISEANEISEKSEVSEVSKKCKKIIKKTLVKN
jgi:GTPase Era involved in 16S rRNA processing